MKEGVALNIIALHLDAHLSHSFLDTQLREATGSLDEANGPCGLVVDCASMPGYDRDARELFVTWNKTHRDRLIGVAVVTTNPMYRMVIGAMSLASSQQMKAFASEAEAATWLRSLAPLNADAA